MSLCGSWKFDARTPITTCGRAFSVIERPMIAGSLPKRDTQAPCEITATDWAVPSVVSSGVNNRPRSVRALQKDPHYHELYTHVWQQLEAGLDLQPDLEESH